MWCDVMWCDVMFAQCRLSDYFLESALFARARLCLNFHWKDKERDSSLLIPPQQQDNHLLAKHEERRRENLFAVGAVHWGLVNQSGPAFCGEDFTFLSVDAHIGVKPQTQHRYDHVQLRIRAAEVEGLWMHAFWKKIPILVLQCFDKNSSVRN